MRALGLVVALALAGCGGNEYVPRPIFSLVIPAGEGQWQRDLTAGFAKTLEAYGYDSKIISYESSDPEAIVAAAKQAPKGKRAPICIVFTRRSQIGRVVSAFKREKREVITVGVDDSTAERVGHVGISAERTAYLWKIRVSQMGRVPKTVLVIFGSEPIKIERITGSFFSRSGQGAEFVTRFRELSEVTQQDMDWAELVVPFGEDAFLRAREMKAKQLFPVSGADTVLEAIRLGDITHAITDDPFQVGLRTAQMARDYHLESLRNPVNNLDCGEVDAEFLRIYLDKRYELPWTVPQGK